MITKLHIENFKCLRDVTVELQPLTVLIGKNDTGKTSFLEALGMLGSLANSEATPLLQEQGINNLIWRGAEERRIEWQATLVSSPRITLPGQTIFQMSIELSDSVSLTRNEQLFIDGVDTKIRRATNGTNAILSALASAAPYRFEPKHMTAPAVFNPTTNNPGESPRLHSSGSGLPAVLDFLLGTRRKVFDQIERELCEAVPQVKGIQVKPALSNSQSGGKSISFELAGGHDIPASLASDGVLFLLAYLILIHAPGAPAVIRLEEPENGIHPRQLERVAEYLKRLTDPSRGANTAQIIVATHSPYFLDFVPPESVIVFGRRENGETVTAPLLSLPGVQARIASGFSLGEMWFNVGEDELLKDLLK